jgi:hypothetical protein
LRNFCSNSVASLSGLTTDCGADLGEHSGFVNRVSAAILVKAKESIAMQTDAISIGERGAQTGDAPPPIKKHAVKKK